MTVPGNAAGPFTASAAKRPGLPISGNCQANNVGPSASTGKLTALVNKGELFVANGDLQMNLSQIARNPNVKIFWPADDKGESAGAGPTVYHWSGPERAAE